jgi:class 3 adenylate cyclase/tetratricopeptide (TPR) repeat protein
VTISESDSGNTLDLLLPPARPRTPPTPADNDPLAALLPNLPGRSSEDDSQTAITLPDGLEQYLPPDLWRKLSAASPRRGVLLNALDRLRSLLYVVSTYLPSHLVQEKMRRPAAGVVRGQYLEGSLLFSDVSGFTALSERLAVLGTEGAERLTDMMNRYFGEMLDILAWSGGILLKFAGDATLVYFPQQENGEQARSAVRAGQRMLRAMSNYSAIETPLGTVGLKMKIGISTGRFLGASIGSAERMEYVVFGEAVARTMAAEGAAEAGLVVIDERTAACHDPATLTPRPTTGFFAAAPGSEEKLDDFEIKAESRRARGAIAFNASPHAITTQMDIAMRQIKALVPFLAAELVESIIAQARQRRLESEFRPTTVIFMNFTGFETLLASLNEIHTTKITNLLSDYFNHLHQAIIRHGGVVTRIDPYSRGSKMLILFGAPVAHEDDPLRAASAALDMMREVAAINAEWQPVFAPLMPAGWEGTLIQQRAGITQGLTYAGQVGASTRREYTVMGDDVNLAARLMSAAQPGQILISQRVYNEVVDHLAATALTPIMVKGKSQPIPIYQVDGRRDDPLSRLLRSRDLIFGRQREIDQGQEQIRQALAGRGGILTIQGPAGIGKTALLEELACYALSHGANVLYSQCRAYSAGLPYTPWINLIRSLAGINANDTSEMAATKLNDLLAAHDMTAETFERPLTNLLGLRSTPPADPAGLRDLRGLPTPPAEKPKGQSSLFARLEKKVTPPTEEKSSLLAQLGQERRPAGSKQLWQRLQSQVAARERALLFQAIGQLLERAAAPMPLVLLLENSQWMDAASRELLAFLQPTLGRLPILVLMAQRSEEAAHLPGEQCLVLAPLTLEDTAALVRHLLKSRELPAWLAPTVYEQSGGNPLYMEEIIHWLNRQENFVTIGGSLRTSTTLQELVLSRVDGLPPRPRDSARVASVIGSEFRYSELCALMPLATEDVTLADHLTTLETARLVFLAEGGNDSRYAFRQTLIREVLYDSQPFARRRDLHAAFVELLEGRDDHEAEQQVALLAHHCWFAEQWLKAAGYLLQAGHNARAHFAFEQAAAAYERALNALDRLPAEATNPQVIALRLEACEARGDAAILAENYPLALSSYQSAWQDAPDDASAETLARLLVKLALVGVGAWSVGRQNREGGANQGKMNRSGRKERGADNRKGVGFAVAQEMAEAVSNLEEAIRLNGSPGYTAAAQATLAWLHWRAGHPSAADTLAAARSLVASPADGWSAAVNAFLAVLAGEWEAAAEGFQALDNPAGLALALCYQGDYLLQQGEGAAATGRYQQAAEVCQKENQDQRGLALIHFRQAEAHWRNGDPAASANALRQAVVLLQSEKLADPHDLATAQRLLLAAESGLAGRWPAFASAYQDAFAITLLFRP